MSEVTLHNSSQLIEDGWLNLVSKYFPDDNISLMKAGLFGYVNEIMAQEIKNSVYHKNFIYDEYLLNTASTAKSIYNFAKIYNVPVDNASPAKVSAVLSVRESDLPKEKVSVNNIADNGNIEQSILSKKTVFSLNGLNFILPYDIQILFNRNITDTSKYIVTARYVIEDEEYFPYLEVNTSILKTWEDIYNGEKYIYIKVDLYQLTCKTKTALVINESNLYNTFYKFAFEGQLAYFNLFYEHNGVTEKINVMNNNNYSLANDQKYCYYNIIDSETLEISFSSLFNSFKPEYGARLLVDIYTTEGLRGNLGTVSDLSVTYAINDFENSTPILIQPVTDCFGGRDKSNLLELKKKIINKNLTRNAIVTEGDLNNFFNTINTAEGVNNSEVRFIKKRNDVLRKVYGAYVLLRDTNNVIMPTRTINNLIISKNQMSEMTGSNPASFTIPERSIIVYDTEVSNYFLVTKEVEIKKYINNSKYLLYTIPYLVSINTENYLSAKYFKTYTNLDVDLEYKYVNKDIPYKFMINSFSVVRNSLENEVYKLSLNFNTNIALTEESLSRIKIRGVLKDPLGNPYGYFEFNRSDNKNLLYEANLSTEKYDGVNDEKLNIYNSLFKISTEPIVNPDGSTSLRNCYIEEGSNIEIQVLFKSKYSSYKYGEANNMPDLITADDDKYASACVFYNDSSIELFRNVTKLTDSIVVPSSVDGSSLVIKSIPVLEHTYFKNNAVQIYRTLDTFHKLLEGNINKLEVNTDIDMKLFNTHGPSEMLYTKVKIDNLTGNKEYVYLDRLDVDLNLNIYLESPIGDDEKESISKYLSGYLESLNKKGVIAISNIISKLEKKFDVISYIEWNSINGDYYQKIVNIEYDNSIDYNFTPEFVNIRKGLSSIDSISSSEKKYNYSLTINYK